MPQTVARTVVRREARRCEGYEQIMLVCCLDDLLQRLQITFTQECGLDLRIKLLDVLSIEDRLVVKRDVQRIE